MPIEDLRTYKELGQRGTELTGYPNASVFHGFRYDPRGVMHGAFDDWAYDTLGIFTFTVELWDMIGAAGIKERDFIEWFREHPEDDDLKLLAWNDQHLGGAGFVSWRPFEHPELGPVEIGGWDERKTFGNPPPQFLLETLAPNTEFTLALARTGPRLELRECRATRLGEDTYHIRAVVVNRGYLPSYGSKRAQERRASRPIEARIALPDGAKLISGEAWQELGQLEGRSNKRALWGDDYPTDQLRTIEWVVQAPAGSSASITVASQRAGTVRGEVRLA
jgi:murein tripeptide amidase MpaA